MKNRKSLIILVMAIGYTLFGFFGTKEFLTKNNGANLVTCIPFLFFGILGLTMFIYLIVKALQKKHYNVAEFIGKTFAILGCTLFLTVGVAIAYLGYTNSSIIILVLGLFVMYIGILALISTSGAIDKEIMGDIWGLNIMFFMGCGILYMGVMAILAIAIGYALILLPLGFFMVLGAISMLIKLISKKEK